MISMIYTKFSGTDGRDEFKRELVAAKVIKLLKSEVDISPMIIDGDWGTGKTEFCLKLINKLKNEEPNYNIIYIDAFKADHADNPLLTIIAEIINSIGGNDDRGDLIRKSLPVIRYGLKVVGKAVVSHALKQNSDEIADGFGKLIEESANDIIDATIKKLLKDHEKSEENIKSLQFALSQIVSKSPLIIFVDELDRCRPDFSVLFIEVIKHIFEIDGVQFVLITNTEQLRAAINHRYGNLVDSKRYLDKFIKFSFNLPEAIPGAAKYGRVFYNASSEHFLNLIRNSEVLRNTPLQNRSGGLFDLTDELIFIHKLSLRDVEKFVRFIEIFHALNDGLKAKAASSYQSLKIISIFVCCFYPGDALKIQRNILDASFFEKIFLINKIPDYRSVNYKWSLFNTLGVLLLRECNVNNLNYITPEVEANNFWNERKRYFFQDAFYSPDSIFSPIKEAILEISMSTQ